jgi:hypothetical protein
MLNNIAALHPAAAALNSYESIQTVLVPSGGQSSISFTVIPATYKHLQIRGVGLSNVGNQRDIWVTLNSDSGANYSWHRLYGDGSSAAADSGANANYMILGRASETGVSNLGAIVFDILDYADSNKYKTARSLAGRDANGSGTIWLNSGSWRSTSAVTTITLKPQSDSWNQYSSFALYGIKG